jgi:hypothetical protein
MDLTPEEGLRWVQREMDTEKANGDEVARVTQELVRRQRFAHILGYYYVELRHLFSYHHDFCLLRLLRKRSDCQLI